LFVGGGRSKDVVEKMASEKFPDVDVEFIDSVPYDKIPNYYSVCDAIYSCFPMTENVKRGLSVKVFESTIMGIPVIVNSGTLNSDYVERYKCGVCVDVNNVEDIKKKLLVLKYIKPFNVKAIRKRWDWKHMEKRLVELYSKIMGG